VNHIFEEIGGRIFIFFAHTSNPMCILKLERRRRGLRMDVVWRVCPGEMKGVRGHSLGERESTELLQNA
jgi:hypothetical protein